MRTDERQTTRSERGPVDLAANGIPSDNDSSTAILRELSARGFGASFRPAPEPVEGRVAVVCGACGRASAAADLHIDGERRLEGASDPDEMVLVVAATCPACGTGGVIVLGYGPEASAEDSDLVLALRRPPVGSGPAPGPVRAAAGPGRDGDGDDRDEGDGGVADPGGDSDPDANEGFEPPEDRRSAQPNGLGSIGAALDRAHALDRLADPIRRSIDARLPDGPRAVLQGRWLGHPLHPVLTDVVIGFWTSAWVLDVVGGEGSEPVADAFVAAGLAAAVPTAWAGWADWIELPREQRRTGPVHAASNAGAIVLYAASLVARRRDRRRLGVGLGHAAASAATVGGFLGGHLAFGD